MSLSGVLFLPFKTDFQMIFLNSFRKYPEHNICLEVEMFELLDLLVELAQSHGINVKLSKIQQLLFRRTKYESLFEFDSDIFPKKLHSNCQLKDRPTVYIKSLKPMNDLNTYEEYVLIRKHRIFNEFLYKTFLFSGILERRISSLSDSLLASSNMIQTPKTTD